MSDVAAVAIRVLGPIQILVDGVPRDLPSRRQRALLAALTVRAGRPVSVTDLVDALWNDDPPHQARTTLQTYVSRLRRVVGHHTIRHTPAGYHFDDNVSSDLDEARAAMAELERLAPGDPRRADVAERALGSWRGPALAELAEIEWFRGDVVELAEMHANLVDLVADAMIRTDRCPQAVALLKPSLESDPWREPTQVLLMRALHGAGRTTDAVRAAARYRRDLRETTGLLPGRPFTDAEQFVLAADTPGPGAPDAGADHPPMGDAGSEADGRPTASSRHHDPGLAAWTSTTLPRATPLVGRRDELDSIERALGTSRLVTVVGVGGVGKTRVAAEVIDRADGSVAVLAVELAPIAPERVLATVGAALGVRGERVESRHLIDVVRGEPVLLVLDNAEHAVVEVRELVRAMVRECPEVRFLVTSRERLDITDEVVVPIAPLAVDGPDSDAVTLFVDRLRRARPNADLDGHDRAIADMCRRVDGIPLALELTASRAAALGVAVVHDRFDSMFEQLVDVDGDQHRHSTLGNVVTWSVDLSSAGTRELLAALSVFQGDFSLDAAEAVGRSAGVEAVTHHLGRLVDTSLVSETNAPGQFRLLAMVHRVARERLVASERADEVRRAHATWVGERLADIDRASVGPLEAETVTGLDAIRRELDVALEWSLGRGEIDVAASILTALAGPLLYRPDADLIGAIRETSSHPAVSGSASEAAIAAADARAAFLTGDIDDVEVLVARADRAVAADDVATRHRAAHALAVARLYQGRFAESSELFRSIVDDPGAAVVERLDALGGLALARCYSGGVTDARALAGEQRATAETVESATYVAFADYALAEIDLSAGDVDAAADRLAAAADSAWRARARFVWGIASTVLARVLVRHRSPAEARRHLPELLERLRRTATWPQLWTTMRLTAEHLADVGDPRTALLILDAADLDPAAPTLSADDSALYFEVRRRIRAEIGDAAASGIATGAGAVDRTVVLDRALDALGSRLDT